jgi:RNA polymerase sigma-70 factor (ECF subfamily)
MDTQTTGELVARIKQGDQEAFSALYDDFAERIYRYIRVKVASNEEAEDILQDVFVKVWHGCKTLDTEDLNFTAWVYKVTSNTVNDHYRKIYRRPQTVSLDPAIDVANNDDTQASIQHKFDSKEIKTALQDLSESYRQVIELRFFQDFTVEETAKIMGKTNLAIRVLQYRATKKLETIYKQHEREAKTIL